MGMVNKIKLNADPEWMNKIGNVFVLRSFPTFGNCARLGFAVLPL